MDAQCAMNALWRKLRLLSYRRYKYVALFYLYKYRVSVYQLRRRTIYHHIYIRFNDLKNMVAKYET